MSVIRATARSAMGLASAASTIARATPLRQSCSCCATFFRERRYQKVNPHVYSFNEPSLRLHERLGFQQEGRLRRMFFLEGVWVDDVIFGMTAEEFEEQHGASLA